MKHFSQIILSLLLIVHTAHACPLVNGLVDFNCDQKLRYVITGDSIVAGLGDAQNNNVGGYVKRVRPLLPTGTRVIPIGISGIRSDQLLRKFRGKEFRKKSRNADLFLIDVGRNDCRDNLPPLRTVRNIKRLTRFARNNIGSAEHGMPFVVVATMIPDRERRRQCIEETNRLLLQKKSNKIPVFLRFDKLPESILGPDKLHPNSKGYQRIAKRLSRFILNQLQNRMALERPDSDADGIYDFHETAKYGTDPALSDTDEDGLLDGEEVFVYGTDPNNPDTDGDSRTDGQEIIDGTNPLIPD